MSGSELPFDDGDNPDVPIPELSVVVASHDRPLRLRWLLNALERQTLDRSLWEVVVCHDSAGPETDALLADHGLARDGTLRGTRLAAGTAPPGANRNAAARIARAPTVVFTDDDCRPPEGWLAAVLDAVRADPDAIIQGPIWGDPDEEVIRESAYYLTQDHMTAPRPWAECCNIVYPRELFERAGGFPEDMHTGEDTMLHRAALALGARYIGAQEMLTFHAIESPGLWRRVRGARRWKDLPRLYRAYPDLRNDLPMWIFWQRTHVWLPLALVGAALARRSRLAWVLIVPWAIQRQAGPGVDGRVRHLAAMPGWAAIDAAETIALLRGAVRHRFLVL